MKANICKWLPSRNKAVTSLMGYRQMLAPPILQKLLHIAFTVSPCELHRRTAKACVTGKVFVAQSVLLGRWQEAEKTETAALQHQFHAVFTCPGRTSQACACWPARCTVGCRLVDVFQNSVLQDETQNARGM